MSRGKYVASPAAHLLAYWPMVVSTTAYLCLNCLDSVVGGHAAHLQSRTTAIFCGSTAMPIKVVTLRGRAKNDAALVADAGDVCSAMQALSIIPRFCAWPPAATHPTVVPVPRMLAAVMGFLRRQDADKKPSICLTQTEQQWCVQQSAPNATTHRMACTARFKSWSLPVDSTAWQEEHSGQPGGSVLAQCSAAHLQGKLNLAAQYLMLPT